MRRPTLSLHRYLQSDHDMDISKWPKATFAKWSALVDQTPAMDWSRKVFDPAKVASCNAKLAASSLLSANATNHDKL